MSSFARASERRAGRSLAGLLAGVSLAATALAGPGERFEGFRVSEIDFVLEGGGPLEEPRELLDIRPGEPYRAAAVRHSIQQIFALGSFSDIRVEARPGEAGTVALTFRLFPALEIAAVEVEGMERVPGGVENWVPALRAESGLSPGTLFDPSSLDAAADRMAASLRRSGFLWARVEPEARFEGHRAVVVFHVELGAQARLTGLRVFGLRAPVERHVRESLGLRPGDLYDRGEIERRLDAVLAGWRSRGYYQGRAEMIETPVPPDGVAVEIRAELGPRVELEVAGVELSRRRRADLLTVSKEKSLSEDLIEESRANLQDHLREQGYADASVEVEQEIRGEGDLLVLRFRAVPGNRYEVRSIHITGARSISAAELMPLLATRASRPFRPAPFRASVWQKDIQEIRTYLRRRGFQRARLIEEIRESSEEEGALDITLHIEEGPRYLIEAVEIEGARAIAAGEIAARSGLRVGASFDRAEVVDARERIVNYYRDRGFRQVDVTSETELDEDGSRALVRFRIHEGAQTLVDRVIVTGIDITRESIVRREITLTPGAPLSSEALFETRQRLLGTGLFRDVQIDVLPRDPQTRSSDVLVRLEEGPRTSFGYGFGYEERELARVEGEITRRNLFGLNRTVSLFARGSFRGSRIIATYRQPDLFGYDLPAFVTAFREEEDRSTFDFIRLGYGFHFSKTVGPRRTLLFRYQFDRTRVFGLEVDPSELDRRFRNIRLSKVSIAEVTDTRDDPLEPSRGQFRILDLGYSAAFLGSRSPFLKALAQQFVYRPLPYGMVGALGLRLGVAQSFREDRDALIPITERFFVGGANTLRGFGLDEASPKDVFGNPVGGNVLTLLNLELRFPIAGKLGGVVFSDSGAVYRRLQVIELLNWRYNLGFGFRYDTPLGPLRVDYGFKVDPRPDEEQEPRGRWHVSLGHAF